MKRSVYLFLILFVFNSCDPKAEKVERVMEDGVEVVLNHLEPYTIKGESSTFSLEKEFSIDTEEDEIAELGLTDIGDYFDVNSEGNTFLVGYENTGGMIFRFDREGNFVRSFARKGQGPGELQGRTPQSLYVTVDRDDNIAVSDFGNKLAVFGPEGDLIKEKRVSKASFMEQFSAPLFDDIRNKIYFPDAMPPFHSFFVDDEGRLFVMTYEAGENPGEYMYDIFNPDGVCTGRKSLKILHDESGIYAKIKNGRLYCLNEKDSGYKELVVSKVIWE